MMTGCRALKIIPHGAFKLAPSYLQKIYFGDNPVEKKLDSSSSFFGKVQALLHHME